MAQAIEEIAAGVIGEFVHGSRFEDDILINIPRRRLELLYTTTRKPKELGCQIWIHRTEFVNVVQGIINENKDKDVRSGWTRATLGKVCDNFPGKNVIIVWSEHDANGLQGCQQGNLMCLCPNQNKTMSYKCYVFDSGDFHLKGDGGYLNWSFAGQYERHDKDLIFTTKESLCEVVLRFMLVSATQYLRMSCF